MVNLQPVTQHRTQVYFPEDLFREIKKTSQKEDISIAEIIRRAVKKEIEVEGKMKTKEKEKKKVWKKFLASAGIGSGPKDLSFHHDQYFKHQ